jgi:hypothetical protein
MNVETLIQLALAAFTALVGWPALLAVAVVALQFFGLLKVASTDTFIFWANVIVFGGIFILAVLGKIDLLSGIDETFGQVAQLITYLLILLGVPVGFTKAKAEHQDILASAYFTNRVARFK